MKTSPAVLDLKDLHLEGNIIPMEWFQHFKYESGKPDVNAIMILSDIVYWYRPTQVRDERTGQVTAYRQKFKHDLLQKSYQSYVDLFGLSKGQVTDAFVRLEGYGVLKRIFRHIETPSGTIPNVLFIEINSEKIKQFSRDPPIDPEIPPDPSGEMSGSIGTYPPIEPETNTETTPKITTETHSARACTAQQMLDLWNQTFDTSLPVQLTSFRGTKLPLILFTHFNNDLLKWQQFCNSVQSSSFLQGKGARGWRATLDWCVEEANLFKILEGNYQDSVSEQTKSPSLDDSLRKAQSHIQALTDPQHQQIALGICAQLSPNTYNSWFQGMRLDARDGTRIVLSFPTRFICDYVEVNYLNPLWQLVQPLYPGPQELELVVERAMMPQTTQSPSQVEPRPRTMDQKPVLSIVKDLARQLTQQNSKPLTTSELSPPFASERTSS